VKQTATNIAASAGDDTADGKALNRRVEFLVRSQ
jgi:outer membrane protein OmpA-like peptidoglycan-associated protein